MSAHSKTATEILAFIAKENKLWEAKATDFEKEFIKRYANVLLYGTSHPEIYKDDEDEL